MRRVPALFTALTALAGATALATQASATTSHPATTGRPATTAPGCQTAGLTIWFDNQLNGTAGTFFYGLKFTNLSGHTCTLRGYPGVSAVDVGGRRVGRPASRMTGHPVRTITLADGRTATASVGIVDTGAVPPSRCHAVTAAGFRVYPPGQRASRVVPFPFKTCSGAFTSLRILPIGS